MSVSKSLRTQPFFFTMELTGPGLQLEDVPSKNQSRISLVVEKETEPKKKKLPDPIGLSIQERRDYGSYLSVVKTAKGAPEDIIKFSVKGIPDSDLNRPAVSFENA